MLQPPPSRTSSFFFFRLRPLSVPLPFPFQLIIIISFALYFSTLIKTFQDMLTHHLDSKILLPLSLSLPPCSPSVASHVPLLLYSMSLSYFHCFHPRITSPLSLSLLTQSIIIFLFPFCSFLFLHTPSLSLLFPGDDA